MSKHIATLNWERDSEDFSYKSYSRDHTWAFDAGCEVRASASPDYFGSPDCVDPEEAFVAALASCHMLTFLSIAARKKFVVDSYKDQAVGFMENDGAGKMAITKIILKPEIIFSGESVPTVQDLESLHHAAHEQCFIANSVTTEVDVQLPHHK